MTFDSIAPLLFQTLCTLALSAVHFGLWRQRRQAFHATWAAAWAVYALRLIFISAFIETRQRGWVFAQQGGAMGSGLLVSWAALPFSGPGKVGPRDLLSHGLDALWALV